MILPRAIACSLGAAFISVFAILQPMTVFAADSALSAPPSGFVSMLQVLFGLGLVLAAIAATAWLLRKMAPGQVAAAGAIRVVGGVAVGPKERVVLVDVGDKRLVLGVAPGRVNTLLEMPRPLDADHAAAKPSAFYAKLKDALGSPSQEAK